MRDSMHCIAFDGAIWKGVSNEDAKNKHLEWYVWALTTYLQEVDESFPGYVDAGWITVNSLLTAPGITGNSVTDSWAVAPNVPFDGHALAC
eukprot:6578298-Heterocapsa_arctica.AAC.1